MIRDIIQWSERLEEISNNVPTPKTIEWGNYAILTVIAFLLIEILDELRQWKK